MTPIRSLFLAFCLFAFHLPIITLHAQERIQALTDKQLYLTGERLLVSVTTVCDMPSTDYAPSRVAYVELADDHHVCAQTMLSLTQGRGWGELSLPSTLHSGNYLLSVYTRATSEPMQQLVAVVNPTRLSRADRIAYRPYADAPDAQIEAAASLMQFHTHRGTQPHDCDTLILSIPEQWSDASLITITLRDNELLAHSASASGPIDYRPLRQQESRDAIPEAEGHIVTARPVHETDVVATTQLVMVGRSVGIYDGQWQPDGSWRYYTYGLTDNHPAMLLAEDAEGNAIEMQFVSPYTGYVPLSLPPLTVYADEASLQLRAQDARLEQTFSQLIASDPGQDFALSLLSATPHHLYDLNEYTKFSTVREILTEYVRGVKHEKVKGREVLFALDPETFTYFPLSALVLLDGMPIDNVADILAYDARLLRYVMIYPERFTFGTSVCGGVIAFVTRQGRLSNFKLDASQRLVAYAFGQAPHPHQSATSQTTGTLFWHPDATAGTTLAVPLPSQPGHYVIEAQAIMPDDSRRTTLRAVDSEPE